MGDTPRPDNDGRSPGEGPERAPDGTYNSSGIARQEQAQKAAGNPKEKQAEAERINREESLYRGGMPVAGHNEPEPENDPGRGRSRSRSRR
jgi:hypothetical protein